MAHNLKKEALVREALWTLPERVQQDMKEDAGYASRVIANREAEQPIVDELRAIGYAITSISNLRNLGVPWKTALPVLIRWLPLVTTPDIKEAIVRHLSVPWVGKVATAELIQEFKNALPGSSLAWAIGNALSIVDVRGFEKEILRLSKDPAYSIGRQMIVCGLSRLRDPEVEDTALRLLDDEDVKLHAIIALRKMKSRRALAHLEELLRDGRPSIRREAKKAITKIKGG